MAVIEDKKLAPLVVIVSGTPGSGKTTFARQLADYMRILHIPRDELFWSLTYTAGEHIDRRGVGIPAYYETLVYLVRQNVSLVTDGTIYKGISEEDIKRYLAPVARLVNIHCRATNEKERYRQREIERYGQDNLWLDEHLQYLDTIYDTTVDPLELGCPRIEVDSTAGYHPSIHDIANQLEDRNNMFTEGNPYRGKRN